jgi:hypothetical protein
VKGFYLESPEQGFPETEIDEQAIEWKIDKLELEDYLQVFG